MDDTQKLAAFLKQLTDDKLSAAAAMNVELKRILDERRRENENLKGERDTLNSEVARLETKLESCKSSNKFIVEDVKRYRKQLEAVDAATAKKGLDLTQAEEAKQIVIQQKLEEYENKKALAVRAIKETTGEDVSDHPIDFLVNSYMERKGVVEASDLANFELSEKNKELSGAVEALTKSNLELSEKNKELGEKNKELEEELATYSKAIGLAAKRKKAAVG